MIKFSEEVVTPEMAAEWLKKNKGNRPVIKAAVSAYARDMQAGKWRPVHQPIAFDARNNLVDGQHRLHAIVKSGECIRMCVARYATIEEAAGLPVDIQKRRSANIIIGCEKGQQEVARAIGCLVLGAKTSPTVAETAAYLDMYRLQIDAVNSAAGTRAVRFRACSAVKAAVAMRAAYHPENAEEILEQYELFVNLESTGKLWPSVKALLKCFESSGRGKQRVELASRAWAAFNPAKKSSEINRLSDRGAIRSEMTIAHEDYSIK